MKFYILTHALTDHNKSGQLMGSRIDEDIDAEGIEQAKLVADKIPADIKSIYASSLMRTKHTAEIVNQKLKVPLEFRDELWERDFGSLSGFTWDHINDLYGEGLKEKDRRQQFDYHEFGGESIDDVKERLNHIIHYIKAKHKPEDKVLVVTHSGILRLMKFLYHNTAPAGVGNTELDEFDI